MKILQGFVEKAFGEVIGQQEFTNEQLDRLVGETMQEVLPGVAGGIEAQLRKQLPSKLRSARRMEAAFVRRNKKRWRKSFSELEFMYHIAAEMGSEFVVEWNSDINDEPCLFAALNTLHVKALITTKEILCLMEGGYADGALARWRTLHEAAVFSTLIREAGAEVAERYLASFDFAALKAAKQLNEYAERANLRPFPPDDLAEMEARCLAQVARLGEHLSHEYGWAARWLNVERPNLLHLEKATGLDHWRPRFRWASQSIHGAYRPPESTLANAESTEVCHAIGPSNSGMVDPLQMAAISLTTVATNFLGTWPNADRLVAILILNGISGSIGDIAMKEEAESLARFLRRGRP
jgi:hypothetical protein